MKVMTAFFPCKYNPVKTFAVTRTRQGKYYVNQLIKGKLYYSKFALGPKTFVAYVTERSIEEINAAFS